MFGKDRVTTGQQWNYLRGEVRYCYYPLCRPCPTDLIVLLCAHFWDVSVSSSLDAATVARGNRSAALTGAGRRLEPPADVVVTSDPEPGVTQRGFSSTQGPICHLLWFWGHTQMGQGFERNMSATRAAYTKKDLWLWGCLFMWCLRGLVNWVGHLFNYAIINPYIMLSAVGDRIDA